MKITRLCAQCITCLLDKNLNKMPPKTDEATQLLYMQRLLKILAEAPSAQSAPEVLARIDALRTELFGAMDDFAELKAHFNRLMLQKAPAVQEKIDASEDALYLAVCYAMLGNYIDFGAMDSVDEDKLQSLIDDAENMQIDRAEFGNLQEDLRRAKCLVYLTDNCGEIVLDKLLIETLMRLYPQLQIDVIVRGAPVLNDATLQDAAQIGLDKTVSVVDNGTAIAGTCLSKISAQAKSLVDAADVVLAKGQGNFETMRYCGKNVYYLFMCKCAMFAERFGVERFSPMLLNDLRIQ